MMKKNYLSDTEPHNIKRYSERNNYLDIIETSSEIEKYVILPDEYNVFSELNDVLFARNDTEQFEMISECLNYIREQLKTLYLSKGIVCVLPKLKNVIENDGTIVFNWAYSHFRIFFSFDSENPDDESYCGLIFQNEEDDVTSQINKISSNNYKQKIDNVLQFMINNS